MAANGSTPISTYETEASANSFPGLPVREGERSFVWFARFADVAAHDRHVSALSRDATWTGGVLPALQQQLSVPTETWRLTPTSRSRSFAS